MDIANFSTEQLATYYARIYTLPELVQRQKQTKFCIRRNLMNRKMVGVTEVGKACIQMDRFNLKALVKAAELLSDEVEAESPHK